MQPSTARQSQKSHRKLHVPRHVAIIMDGNGRWATDRSLARLEGHRVGVENIRSVLKYISECGVEYVTLFAFSTENWTRPTSEVEGIIEILQQVINDETRALHEQGVRIVHLGRTDRLSPELKEAVAYAQKLTKNNKQLTLAVAFDYGGRSEIVEAVRSILRDGIPPEELDEEVLARHLYTEGFPDPDLVIRTGGEQRLSNFLLWQSAYSEFFSTPTLWPDLEPKDIAAAFQSYHRRKRRFGAISSRA